MDKKLGGRFGEGSKKEGSRKEESLLRPVIQPCLIHQVSKKGSKGKVKKEEQG